VIELIRNIIGRLTMPSDVFEYAGDIFVECYSMPDWSKAEGYHLVRRHAHQYRKIEQGFWGNWRQMDSWLGLNNPLAPQRG
jgi:hypothetical protein